MSRRRLPRLLAAALLLAALPGAADPPRRLAALDGKGEPPPSSATATEYLLAASGRPGEAPAARESAEPAARFQADPKRETRQLLVVTTPFGADTEAVSGTYPAPATGWLRVEHAPTLGERGFRLGARFEVDGVSGFAGLALADPGLGHVIAGTVPGASRSAPRVDLSLPPGEWTIERGETFEPKTGHWFRLELRAQPTENGLRLAVFAWQDGEPRPERATVTAEGRPKQLAVGALRPAVWAAGSGVRRFGDLIVQALPDQLPGGRGESADPPPDEWPIEVVVDDVHYDLADAPPDLTLPVDPLDPPPPERAEPASAPGARAATATCDPYRDHWDGAAPSRPGSSSSLRLPPRDDDCDGAFDEDPANGADDDGDGAVDEDSPAGDAMLHWVSSDSKLGARALVDTPAALLRITLCWPSPREIVAFASASGGTWLVGVAQSVPLAGGDARVGAGWSSVLYDLGPAASSPLAVALHESGAPMPDGAWYDRAVTITAVASGGSGTVTTAATIDGAPHRLGSSYGVEGWHTVHVDATDTGGGSASAESTFGVDLSPPAITVLDPLPGSLLGAGAVTVSGEVSADAVTATVAGQPAALGDPAGEVRPFTSAPLALPEGASVVPVAAVDGAGRTASFELALTVDSLAPSVTLLEPALGPDGCLPAGQPVAFSGGLAETHPAGVTLAVTTSDGAALAPAVTLAADGRSWSAEAVDPGGADGRVTATVTATDALGRSARAARSLPVDSAAPTLELRVDGAPFPGAAPGAAPPAGAQPTLLARAVAPTVLVTDGALAAPPAAVLTLDGQPYAAGAPISGEGEHLLVASATDCAGHSAAAHALFRLDLTPPALASTDPAEGAVLADGPAAFSGASDPDLAAATVNGAAATVTSGAFTLSPCPWREGVNTVAIELTDAAGHRAAFTRTFTVRSIAPTVEILETGAPILPGALFTRAIRPEVRPSDPDAALTVTLDGAPFASGTEIAATGDYQLAASLTDALGRTASASASFRVDLSPGPTVAIAAPADGETVAATAVDVTGSATGNAVTVEVNGVPATLTGGQFAAAAVPLTADELTTLTAVATDAAGRTARHSVTVFARTGAPQVVILEPADGATTTRAAVDLAGVVLGGAAATADGTVDAAGLTTPVGPGGAFRALDVPLADGPNTLTVTAVDGFGRSGSASVAVTVDRTPPAIAVLADGQPVADGASFSGPVTLQIAVTDAAATPPPPAVRLDGAPVAAAAPTVELTVEAGGGHVLEVVALDAAGNEARLELAFSIEPGGCVLAEVEPPDGSAVAAAAVTLRGLAARAGTVTVRVPVPGSDPPAFTDYPAVLADGTFLAADVPLPAPGPATLELVCTDAAGAAAVLPLTLERLADGSGPAVAVTSPADGTLTAAASLTVTGTVADDGAAVTVNGLAATLTPAGAGTATFAATLALAEGPNPVRVLAVDAAGRTGSARVVVHRDGRAPRVQVTSPSDGATVGPDGSGAAAVGVSGLVDLTAEPHLDAVIVTTAAGTVAAAVDPATGAFAAAAVPLAAGLPPDEVQAVTVTAVDTLGRAGSSSVSVRYDPTGPALALAAPSDNALLTEASPALVEVSGEAWAAEGARVELNGASLDPASLAWDPPAADGRRHVAFAAQVERPATDGAFAVVARVVQLDGRSATARRLLVVDGAAPEVLETSPADAATGVDPNTLVLALLSEPPERASLAAADGLTLTRLATGDPVVGTITVSGQAVAFAPGAALAAGESYRLRLGAHVTDPAAHPLAAPVEATFAVAADAAAPPVLDPLPPVVCATELVITGAAAPGARVTVRAGDLAFSGFAGAAGAFAVTLPLPGDGYHLLRVTATDALGRTGPAATATVRVDCSAPAVVRALLDRDAATLTVELSEAVDPTTATVGLAGAAFTLDDAELPGAAPDPPAAATVDGAVVTLALDSALDAWWRDRPLRLTVSAPLADLEGNAVAAPWQTVFSPGGGAASGGFLTGEAWSDAVGRPLEGAAAGLWPAGAALPGAVAPGAEDAALQSAVADGRGRFQMVGEVPTGRYVLLVSAPGHAPVARRLTLGPGVGAVPFDARLAELAEAAGQLDPVTGGALAAPDEPLLELVADPAAVPGLDPVTVRLTPLDGQALPDLLPLGWTPAAAAELRLEDASGPLPAGASTPFAAGGVRLTLPLPAWVLASDDLAAARYDLAAGAWRALAAPERLDGPQGEPLARVSLDGPGAVAVLLADEAPAVPPPPAVPGADLLGAPAPSASPAFAADLALDPPAVPPTGRARARVVVRSADLVTPWPSGLAVRAVLAERLRLTDGSELLEAPFTADLVLYRPRLEPAELAGADPAAAGAAELHVSPSPRAARVLLDVGWETVDVFPFPEPVERGRVVGPAGGTVTGDAGLELDVPEGALPAATVVGLSAVDPAGLPPVEGFTTLAAIQVSLGGRRLARPATLRLPTPAGAPAAVPGDPRLVLAFRVEEGADGRGPVVEAVARAFRPTPERVVAAPEAAGSGLPLEGLRDEGLYLLLHADASFAWAAGTVRGPGGAGLAGARVSAAGLGTADLAAEGGGYAAAVPAAGGTLTALHPTIDERGEAAVPALAPGAVATVDLTVVPVPPAVAELTPAANATGVAVGAPVTVRFSEPLDPATVAASTLTLALAGADGLPTGAVVRAGLTLVDNGTRLVLQPELPLGPGRTFVATLAGGVRDAGGTPYSGGVVRWSFTTATVWVPGGEVRPERFRVERPAGGIAAVVGNPGALPIAPAGSPPWTVSPLVEGSTDPTTDSFPADGAGGVAASVGHPPAHPVTENDRIWLRVFDPSGALAATFRLGPFATPDGRGFVAPGGEPVSFTTSDGVTVDVPEVAFAEPTLVTVTPLDPADLGADLPDGMALGAYVQVDFEGEAADTLRLHVPAPAGLPPGTQAFMASPVDLPWGRRLRLVDVGGVLQKDGADYLSNDPTLQPEPGAGGGGGGLAGMASLDSAPTSCAEARAQGEECLVEGALPELTTTQAIGVLYEQTTDYVLVAGRAAFDRAHAVYNALEDALVFLPKPRSWSGLYLLPVPAGSPFRVVERDAATGWIDLERDHDPVQFDTTLVEVDLGLPVNPPMLVAARPFDVIRFAAPPEGVVQPLRLEVEAAAGPGGKVAVRSAGAAFPLPEGSSLSLLDVTPTFPLDPRHRRLAPVELLAPDGDHGGVICGGSSSWQWSVPGSADMMLVLGPADLDAAATETLELEFDRPLQDLSAADPATVARLLDLGPGTPCEGAPTGSYPREIPLLVDAPSRDGGTRLVLRPAGGLPAGHRFRLELHGEAITTRPVAGETATYAELGSAPTRFYFATRPTDATPVGMMPGGPDLLGDTSTARDLLRFGNLMLAASSTGRLLAIDLSGEPADPTQVQQYRLHALANSAYDQVRALATDGHGRLFFNALLGSTWAVHALRVEDARNADATCAGQPDWASGLGCFDAMPGGVRTAFGAGSGAAPTLGEYLGGSGLVAGTPVDLEVLASDEEGAPLDLEAFYAAYRAPGEPESLAELTAGPDGSYTLDLELRSSYERATAMAVEPSLGSKGTPLDPDLVSRPEACDGEAPWDRFQRVTVDNLATGERWSFDLENPWPDGSGTGRGRVTVTARPGERLRVRYNLRAYGYLAVMGSGITVVDLNRFYRLPSTSSTSGGSQCGRRLAAVAGEHIDFASCNPPGSGPQGLAFTPSLAVQGPAGCAPDGTCTAGGPLTVYSPLVHLGAVVHQSPATRPGNLSHVPPPACISEVSGQPTQLRAVALATGVDWVDHGLRGTLGGSFAYDPVAAEQAPHERTGDLLALSLGDAGVFVFNVASRHLALVGHLLVPGHSVFRLQADPTSGRLFAGGFDATGDPVLDIWDLAAVNVAPCPDGTACEHPAPSPVASLTGVPWLVDHLALDGSGTGLLHTWSETTGATAVALDGPRFRFAGLFPADGGGAPVERSVSGFVPLGVPMELTPAQEAANRANNERAATPALRLRVALPGALGETVTARVQSLRTLPDERQLAAETLGRAAAPPGGPGWPDPEVELTLRRIGTASTGGGGRLSTEWSLYESVETVLLIADPRAASGYDRQDIPDTGGPGHASRIGDEAAQCRRCGWPSFLPDPSSGDPALADVVELLASGPYIRAYLTPGSPAATFFAARGSSYPSPIGTAEVHGWADAVPSPIQVSLAEPARGGASFSPGEAGVAVSMVAGDALLTATDHAVAGRGLGFAFERSYRSGGLGFGPLGSAPWTSPLFAHLREIPTTGEVEYHDGSGAVWRFIPATVEPAPDGFEPDARGSYYVPVGLAQRLEKLPGGLGWRLTGPHNEAAHFDERGLLVELRDRLRQNASDPEAQGNALRLVHDAFGRLTQAVDDLGRVYTFGYDDQPGSPTYGLLTRLTDFAGRLVEYRYDAERRLHEVVLPPVTTAVTPDHVHPEPALEYVYGAQSFDAKAAAHGPHFSRLRLAGFRLPHDPGETPPLRLGLAWDGHGRVTSISYPGSTPWQLEWTPGAGEPSGFPVTAVDLTTPWADFLSYQVDGGRTLSITNFAVEVLDSDDPTPVDPGSPVVPTATLQTVFAYRTDGRVDRVTRPDGSVTEYVYRIGDHLVRTGVEKVIHRAGSAARGGAGYDLVESTNDYGADQGGVDNLPGATQDPLSRTRYHGQTRLETSGDEPTAPPTFQGVVGGQAPAIAATRKPDVWGRPTEIEAGHGTPPGGSTSGDVHVKLALEYGKTAAGPDGSGLLESLTVGEGNAAATATVRYDRAGNIAETTTSYGTGTRADHDEWNRAIRVVAGRAVKVGDDQPSAYRDVSARVERGFDAAGRLVHERRFQSGLPDGFSDTTWSYDDRGQLLSVTATALAPASPGGALRSGTTTLSYRPDGLLDRVTSAAGVALAYHYDATGRVSALERPGVPGSLRHRRYDSMGRLVYASDGHEAAWRGRYDAWGRLYEEELPTGVVVRRDFDAAGQLTKETLLGPPEGDPPQRPELAVTEYAYTAAGQVERVREHLGGGLVRHTVHHYDTSGRIIETFVSDGQSPGRRVQAVTFLPDVSGRLATVTDAGGSTATYSYPGAAPWPSSVLSEEASLLDPREVATITDLGYDALGRVVSTAVRGGGPATEVTLDEAGNVLSSASGGALPNRSVMTYDSRGLPLTATRQAVADERRWGWDLDGRTLSSDVLRQDGSRELTTFAYDAAGRLAQRTRPGSPIEAFRYHPDDTLAEADTRLANADASARLTLRYTYDAANRMIGVTPLNRADFEGDKLPAGLDALDLGDSFAWDVLSRPTDAARRLASGTLDPAGRVQTDYFPDDPRPLPWNETVGILDVALGGALTRTWDLYDNPSTLALPGSLGTLSWTFDELDRPVSVGYVGGISASFSWAGSGRLLETVTSGPAHVIHRFRYDQTTGLLQSLGLDVASRSAGELSYQWDGGAGLKVGRTPGGLGADVLIESLGWSWRHDGAQRLAGAEGAVDGWAFDYGRADELESIVGRDGVSDFASGIEGRPTHRTGPGGDSHTFAYDGEGRRLADGRHAFTWDWRGRLLRVDLPPDDARSPGERIEYLYDATGRMLTRTHLGAVPDGGGDADRPFLAKRLFVWDGARLAAEVGLNFLDQPIWRRSYLPGPSGLDDAPQVRVENGLLTDTPTDTVYAFLRDELGTVIGLVEDRSVGATDPLPLLARYLYTPYGEAHLEAGPEPLEVSFDPNVGQVGDAHQLPAVPEMTMGGALRARFTLPLDPDTLADGVSLERLDGLDWLPVDPAEVAVGLDPDDPADLLVMLVAAWPGDTRYRLTLTTALTDQAARPLQLPPGMLVSVEVELGIPADHSAPTGLPREFPLLFDNIHAASSSLDDRFPGGQTLLFQGLWTDPTTGLAYARNRWYDARSASWLSEDPMGAVDSPNLYAFVGWAPHMGTDPMGESLVGKALKRIADKPVQSVVRKRVRTTIYRAYRRELIRHGWCGLYETAHVIPKSFYDEFGSFFDDIGFQIDSVKNFVALPKKETKRITEVGRRRSAHQGWTKEHAEYSRDLQEQVDTLRQAFRRGDLNRHEARGELEKLRDGLQRDLLEGKIQLTDEQLDALSGSSGAVALGFGLFAVTGYSVEALADERTEEVVEEMLERDRAKNAYVRYGTAEHYAPESGPGKWLAKGVDLFNPVADVKDISDLVEDLSGVDWVTGKPLFEGGE